MSDTHLEPDERDSEMVHGHRPTDLFAVVAAGEAEADGGLLPEDPWDWVAPAEGLVSKLVPGFTEFELLGQGGMGAVYCARQTSIGRSVAIKLLNPHLGRFAAFVGQFEEEAKILGRLATEGIVRVLDHGRRRLGDVFYYFIVMEFVSGSSLEELSRRGALDSTKAVRYVLQAARALHEVHESGVIHRDLKPSNILIEEVKDRAVVVDFGLARVSTSGPSALTRAAMVAGSGPFSAPEQMQMGPPERIGSWTDTYSLGMTLYHLLRPGIPLVVVGREVAVQLPDHPRLEAVIRKATRPNSDERYRTMLEFAAALEQLSIPNPPPRPEPVSLPPQTVPPPLPQPRVTTRGPRVMPPISWPKIPRWRTRYLAATACFFLVGFSVGWLAAVFISLGITAFLIPELPVKWRLAALVATLCGWQWLKLVATSPVSDPAKATALRPFENTLGMKFVPLPGRKVLIGVQATDERSYHAWSLDQPDTFRHEMRVWAGRGGSKGIATGATWVDARDFAEWLSKKEGRRYRLPTKNEWLAAVGPKGVVPMKGPYQERPEDANRPNSLGIEPLRTTEWCLDRAELDELRRASLDWMRGLNAQQSKAADRAYFVTCLGDFLGGDRAEVSPSEAPWDERATPDLTKPRGEQGSEGGALGYGFRCVLELD